MQKTIITSFVLLLVGCTSPQQIQQQADQAFDAEYQLWNEVGTTAEAECPKAKDRKTQLTRQICIESLVQEHVRPAALYPNLVDHMLARVRDKTEEYADGKISRDEYTQSVNTITHSYWDSWGSVWDNKMGNTVTSGGSGYAFGQMLLGGINAYNTGLQARRERAESSKTLYCTTYGNTARCNQY